MKPKTKPAPRPPVTPVTQAELDALQRRIESFQKHVQWCETLEDEEAVLKEAQELMKQIKIKYYTRKVLFEIQEGRLKRTYKAVQDYLENQGETCDMEIFPDVTTEVMK